LNFFHSIKKNNDEKKFLRKKNLLFFLPMPSANQLIKGDTILIDEKRCFIIEIVKRHHGKLTFVGQEIYSNEKNYLSLWPEEIIARLKSANS
jgi:hypothetical protein